MRTLAAILLAALCCPAFAQTPETSRPGVTPPRAAPSVDEDSTGATAEDVAYGKVGRQTLRLDVYRPRDDAGSRHRAIVLIHGGAWVEGDKASMAGMARWLARNGYTAFSIDYRLLDGKRNRWPAQLDDAQRAVRWVRANAAKYDINPARVGAFGHSAGAQMASLLGELPTRDNSDPELAALFQPRAGRGRRQRSG